ncbi:GXWXG protein [Sinorhizobium sp. NFACC03]|nr:GXWXG protein [Sinorhizobium sp. NFACC03]
MPPIEPRELVGLWKGRGIPAGHPFDGVLENLGWFGKRFTPDMRADALLFRSSERRLEAIDPKWIPLGLALRFHQLGRTRVARNLFSYLQHRLRAPGPVASLKSLVSRGGESAAMVYDHQPIIDYFRRIDELRVMGAMTIRGDDRIYFFELERVDEP